MRKLFLALFAFCLGGDAQVLRVDPLPTTTIASNAPAGALTPLLAIPGATIGIDGQTYTDSTGTVGCPSYAPVTLAGNNVCQATSDAQGNFGFWLRSRSSPYNYTITLPSGDVYGPYPLTVIQANGASVPGAAKFVGSNGTQLTVTDPASVIPNGSQILKGGNAAGTSVFATPDVDFQSALVTNVASLGAICDGTYHAINDTVFLQVFNNRADNQRGYALPAGSVNCVVNAQMLANVGFPRYVDLNLNGSTLTNNSAGGGVACSQGVGGAFLLRGGGGDFFNIHDGTILVSASTLGCVINFSGSGESDNYSHAMEIGHVVFGSVSGSTTSANMDAIYTFFSGNIYLHDSVTYGNVFRSAFTSGNQLDIVTIARNSFEQTTLGGPQIIIDGAQGVNIENNNLELSGVRVTDPGYGTSTVNLIGNWLGDGCPATGYDIAAGSVFMAGNFIYEQGTCPAGNVGINVRSTAAGLTTHVTIRDGVIFGPAYGVVVNSTNNNGGITVDITGNKFRTSTAGIVSDAGGVIADNTFIGTSPWSLSGPGFMRITNNNVGTTYAGTCTSTGGMVFENNGGTGCGINDTIAPGVSHDWIGTISSSGAALFKTTATAMGFLFPKSGIQMDIGSGTSCSGAGCIWTATTALQSNEINSRNPGGADFGCTPLTAGGNATLSARSYIVPCASFGGLTLPITAGSLGDNGVFGTAGFDGDSLVAGRVRGKGTVTATAQSASGATGTMPCATGFQCTPISGVVTLTTGATGLGTGPILNITYGVAYATSEPFPNCSVKINGTGSYPELYPVDNSSTILTISTKTALSASTAYQVRYTCIE